MPPALSTPTFHAADASTAAMRATTSTCWASVISSPPREAGKPISNTPDARMAAAARGVSRAASSIASASAAINGSSDAALASTAAALVGGTSPSSVTPSAVCAGTVIVMRSAPRRSRTWSGR